MIASLAQAVALVAHGNAFLARGSNPPDLTSLNSAFQYVGELQFIRSSPQTSPGSWLRRALPSHTSQNSTVVYVRTNDWFEFIRASRVKRLSLADTEVTNPTLPSHIAIAFAGSSHWGILAESSVASSWWCGREELIDAPRLNNIQSLLDFRPTPRAGNRIWRVTYKGAAVHEPLPPRPQLAEARQNLSETLRTATQFAEDGQLESWRKWFEEAQAQLYATAPRSRSHPDMLPENSYNTSARQLLAAASSAWVFGGMGSWNDLGFDGLLKEPYDQLTPRLYAAVIGGIVAATNAFDAETR